MLWGRKFLWSQNLGNTDSDGVKRAPLCNCQGLGALLGGCGIQELSTAFAPNGPLPSAEQRALLAFSGTHFGKQGSHVR